MTTEKQLRKEDEETLKGNLELWDNEVACMVIDLIEGYKVNEVDYTDAQINRTINAIIYDIKKLLNVPKGAP